jgi:4-hydroxy-tetrahydrodipicolinate synthase
LISGLHTYFSKKEIYYKNLLPPLSILNTKDESDLINNLEKLNFSLKNTEAA